MLCFFFLLLACVSVVVRTEGQLSEWDIILMPYYTFHAFMSVSRSLSVWYIVSHFCQLWTNQTSHVAFKPSSEVCMYELWRVVRSIIFGWEKNGWCEKTLFIYLVPKTVQTQTCKCCNKQNYHITLIICSRQFILAAAMIFCRLTHPNSESQGSRGKKQKTSSWVVITTLCWSSNVLILEYNLSGRTSHRFLFGHVL